MTTPEKTDFKCKAKIGTEGTDGGIVETMKIVDLNILFHPLEGSAKAQTTSFIVKVDGVDTDLNEIFEPVASGAKIPMDTKYSVGTTDLRDIFAGKDTIPADLKLKQLPRGDFTCDTYLRIYYDRSGSMEVSFGYITPAVDALRSWFSKTLYGDTAAGRALAQQYVTVMNPAAPWEQTMTWIATAVDTRTAGREVSIAYINESDAGGTGHPGSSVVYAKRWKALTNAGGCKHAAIMGVWHPWYRYYPGELKAQINQIVFEGKALKDMNVSGFFDIQDHTPTSKHVEIIANWLNIPTKPEELTIIVTPIESDEHEDKVQWNFSSEICGLTHIPGADPAAFTKTQKCWKIEVKDENGLIVETITDLGMRPETHTYTTTAGQKSMADFYCRLTAVGMPGHADTYNQRRVGSTNEWVLCKKIPQMGIAPGRYFKTEYKTRNNSFYAAHNKYRNLWHPITMITSIDVLENNYIHFRRYPKYYDNSPDRFSTAVVKEYSYMDSGRYGWDAPNNMGAYINPTPWAGTSLFAEYVYYPTETEWIVKPINRSGDVMAEISVTIPANSLVFPVAVNFMHNSGMATAELSPWESMGLGDSPFPFIRAMNNADSCNDLKLISPDTVRWTGTDCEQKAMRSTGLPVIEDTLVRTQWYALNAETGHLKLLGGATPALRVYTASSDDFHHFTMMPFHGQFGSFNAEKVEWGSDTSHHVLAPIGGPRSIQTSAGHTYMMVRGHGPQAGDWNSVNDVATPTEGEYTLSTIGDRSTTDVTGPYGVDGSSSYGWTSGSSSALDKQGPHVMNNPVIHAAGIRHGADVHPDTRVNFLAMTQEEYYSSTVPDIIINPWDVAPLIPFSTGNLQPSLPASPLTNPPTSPLVAKNGKGVHTWDTNDGNSMGWNDFKYRFKTDKNTKFTFNPPPGYNDDYTVSVPHTITDMSSGVYFHGILMDYFDWATGTNGDAYYTGVISTSDTSSANIPPAPHPNGTYPLITKSLDQL